MSSAQDIDYGTLNWVKSEIDATLDEARKALEVYVENSEDESQLRFCINHLHQVHGTLQMVELYGAALAAEEMESLAVAISVGEAQDRDAAFEVLMRGILQLPDYLERLQQGLRDMPMVLLPLLNDLRAARGEALLSENALFSPDLEVNAPPLKNTGDVGEDLAARARRLRHDYQLGLLAVLRNRGAEAGLEKLHGVLQQLRQVARENSAAQLLWTGAAMVEALRDGGLELGASAKTLLGQLDRSLRRVIEHGERDLGSAPPRDLLTNLLYCVGRATSAGPLVAQVKNAFRLEEQLLDEESLEEARAGLSGPNAALLETVSAELRESLNQVKEHLDVFVRSENRAAGELEPLCDGLHQMADTLGMLGLGPQRRIVQEQMQSLRAMHEGESEIDDDRLMEVARQLLSVENALDDMTGGGAATAAEEGEEAAPGADYQRVLTQAVGEARGDLTRVKEALNTYSAAPADSAALAEVPGILHGIASSLTVMNLGKAAELVEGARQYIEGELLGAGTPPSAEQLDALADAVSSIEYFLESISERWGSPQSILDVAERSLDALGVDAAAAAEPEPVAEAAPVAETPATDPPAEDAPIEFLAPEAEPEASIDMLADDAQTAGEESAAADAEPQETAVAPQAEADDGDEEATEILLEGLADAGGPSGLDADFDAPEEIFLDAAAPELLPEDADDVPASPTRLDEALDVWLLDPADGAAAELAQTVIDELRSEAEAAGHTAVAPLAAELSRLISEHVVTAEGSLPAEAVDALYARRDALLQAVAAPSDTAAPGERAEEGEEIDLVAALDAAPEAEDAVPAPAADAAPPAAERPALPPEIDDEIVEIFLEEAEEEFGNIGTLLPRWAADPADAEALRDLRRSFHTLKGSGRLVGAGDVGEFAWAFENMLNRVIDGSIAAEPPLVALLERGRDALPQLFELFRTGQRPGQHVFRLMEQAEKLARGEPIDLDASAADTGSEAGEASALDAGTPAEASEPDRSEAAEPDAPDAMALAGADEDPAAAPDAGDESPADALPVDVDDSGFDPHLLEIWSKEAAGHLQTLRDALARCREPDADCAVRDELLRALHTLRGSSRTAGIGAVADLTAALERYTKLLQEKRLPLSAEALDVLEAATAFTEQAVADGAGAADVERGDSGLLARVAALQEEAQTRPAASAAPQPVAREYDDDLLDIFLEEGSEILDASEQTLDSWRLDPDSPGLLEQFQRELHTLKGGARMCGVVEIGDLSHSLESLLTKVSDGHVPVGSRMFTLLQRAHDRLVQMLEQVRERAAVVPAPDLMAAVDAYLLSEREGEEGEGEADAGEDGAAELSAPVAEPAPETSPDPIPDSTPDGIPDSIPAPAPAQGAAPAPLEPPAPLPPEPAEVPVPAHVAEQAEEDGGDRRRQARVQHEQVRVRADLLDNLVNFAGEVSIYRSRLDQQMNVFRYDLHELDETVARLREQLRNFEIETEAQIQYRYEDAASDTHADFDPLEFDRFTTMQQLSRSMMESLNDLDSLRGILSGLTRESETLLLQQARVNTELQEGLMRARMVPFGTQAPRLRRIVRQACAELHKEAELRLVGAEHELDRQVLDRVMAPIEHMLRNAVAHGIETPQERREAGKPEAGTIAIDLGREGSEVVIRVRDDGGGINFEAIRAKAVKRGLIAEDAQVTRAALADLILESGFSTAKEVTQIAGRGVGMDVVASEIKQLGGTLQIDSEPGQHTEFTVRLPLTLSVTKALVLSVGEESFAVPLFSIEGVERIGYEELAPLLAAEDPVYEWVGQDYRFLHLASVMGLGEPLPPAPGKKLPLLLTRAGDQRAAVLVEGLQGSREIVVKSVGPQLSTLRGISGATITGDGEVQLILDLGVLVRLGLARDGMGLLQAPTDTVEPVEELVPTVMVVDDSITVRKVTSRLLERNDYRVLTAKDGVDALAQLEDELPDVILLDIEMPRMDGFELATNIRNSERLRHIPIVMITSRVADKHRERAMQIGVNAYMGKPFQESELLEEINRQLAAS